MFGLFTKSKEVPVEARGYMDDVREVTEPVFGEAPFKMKRGEQYIGSAFSTLYLWKNNGNVGAHGVTARVKIMKGVYYRVGAGQMGMQKSWVADQGGELHFTTDRIIFNGDNKNYSTPWHKVIGFTITSDGMEITIDRETGADWVFRLDAPMSVEEMATVIMVEENKI